MVPTDYRAVEYNYIILQLSFWVVPEHAVYDMKVGGGGRLKGTAGYGGAHLTQIATLASFMNGKI